jgi:hypothetical protein
MAKKKRFPEPTYMTIEEVRNYAKHNLYSDWGPVGPTLAAIVLELLPEDDGGYGDGKPASIRIPPREERTKIAKSARRCGTSTWTVRRRTQAELDNDLES